MKGYRKIVVDNKDWHWKSGGSFVVIKDPDGKGYTVPINDLFPAEDVERAAWKRYLHITPKTIKNYIMNVKTTDRIDSVALLKQVFRGNRYAEYAGGTLTIAVKEEDWKQGFPGEKSALLMFNVGEGKSAEEDCWIALNYIKYKKNGCYFDQALEIVRNNPAYKKLCTIAFLKQG